MKKLFSQKALLFELVGFVFLQIIIDMLRLVNDDSIQIFGISVIELINILYLGVLTVTFFFVNLKKPKVFIPIVIYSVLVGVYSVLHIMNILNFNQDILTGSELNWFKEIYFIIRTYLIPIFVFYYFLFSDLSFKMFEKVVTALSIIISSVIVITNIFKISFICYASTLEKNSFITRNIFEWFYNPDKEYPSFMTSKGWFFMGNQIGIILFMIFVFVVMLALKYGTVSRYLLLCLNGIALVMIGTKVSTIGGTIVLAVGFIFAIIFGVLLKQFNFKWKQFIMYFISVALVFVLIAFSPMFSIQQSRTEAFEVTEEQKEATEEMMTEVEIQEKGGKLSPQFIKSFSKYVNENPYLFRIEPEFLELFPIEENFKFWHSIIVGGSNWQVDYRLFKSKIYEEVIRINSNEMGDKLFGIGYISNFPYSEKDFVSQNIWFGYLGTALFICPYILVAIYGVYLALRKIKKCFIYENGFFALGICAPLLLSIMAGHLFFGIFSITIFAFIVVGFYKFQTERKKG